jgi:hypothetical protein
MTCGKSNLVIDIINGAYRKIGVLSEFTSLTGQQTSIALEILNEILGDYESSPSLIAYDDSISFPIGNGKISYEFSNEPSADVVSNKIARVKYVTLDDGSKIYPVDFTVDNKFFTNIIDKSSTGRPKSAYLQNEIKKSFIVFDVNPDQDYTANLKAKFVLQPFSSSKDEINTVVPIYYITCLKYELAKRLSHENVGTNWDENMESYLYGLKQQLQNNSDNDMTVITTCALKGRPYGGYYY